jgi:uncharacterized damage-inducible protein DinB
MSLDIEHADERTTLEAHLEDNRETVLRKCGGLSWEDATRRLGPTPTSVAGILKHLVNVERWWFRHNLAGESDVPFDWTDDELDLEFEMGPGDSLDTLLAAYAVACEESRAVAAGHSLDDQAVRAWHGGRRPSLRWIYVHMIEELARHNGHLDIYRELLDGQTDRDE